MQEICTRAQVERVSLCSLCVTALYHNQRVSTVRHGCPLAAAESCHDNA